MAETTTVLYSTKSQVVKKLCSIEGLNYYEQCS